VLFAVAACSSLGVSSTEPAQPVSGKLSTKPGKVLTIAVGRLLAATNGVTPVAFGKPAHGSIAYGEYGAMIYTPDAGFTGTDQLHGQLSSPAAACCQAATGRRRKTLISRGAQLAR
jgi:hypothetical protein